ncbi:hypothetical protein PGTUg99_037091 [Puccinia graminis f. sp. tritici]|uniref:Uncharacterized protein n=1 Tax=Puccinia graminis f. sp. tritici TaxID=56615 RepID=A0A5B0RC59_PUCGR|nr:hypothetical protein PGTUg99_037091 [Puccinia graminis f. sp. tritici]
MMLHSCWVDWKLLGVFLGFLLWPFIPPLPLGHLPPPPSAGFCARVLCSSSSPTEETVSLQSIHQSVSHTSVKHQPLDPITSPTNPKPTHTYKNAVSQSPS